MLGDIQEGECLMTKELVITGELSTPTIQQAIDRYNLIVEYTKRMMQEGKDYGTIPGTGKPTLYKPGAEKLCSLFGLYPEFQVVDSICDFDKGLFYFNYKCILSHNGKPIASGDGSCNSKEKKYRYRNVTENKATEKDKQNALRVETKNGKYGKYKVYVVENTEPFELVNTISKMAQKRALVAATLIAANASEFFTQDLEDLDTIEGDFQEVEAPQKNQPAKKAAPKSQSKPPPQKPAPNGDRPYKPVMLQPMIAEWSEMYKAPCEDRHRKMLAKTLTTIFEGDKQKRYELCANLTGQASTKDIPDAYVQAMLKTWLEIDGWDQPPSEIAIKEAHTLLDYIRTPEAE